MRAAIQAHVGKEGALEPADIADGVMFVIGSPRRMNVDVLSIRPTIDTMP